MTQAGFPRFHSPTVTLLFVLLVLVSLVSFGVSGIYLSFLLTVIGAGIARMRGWVPGR